MRAYALMTAIIIFGSLPAQSKQISACSVIVNGRDYINGPCEFVPTAHGDFMIKKGLWFGYINKNDDGTADFSWNDDNGYPESHANYFGTLTRQDGPDGCWSNEHAIVCARR